MSARDLRELAESATPGPWDAVVLGSEGYDVRATREGLRRRLRVARFGYEEWETDRSNAEYVAAANPQRVLALLDDLAAAESRAADLEARIRALAAKWEAVAQTRPVANIGCPGGPGDYARDIQYRAVALRALVGDETPGTGEGA